MFALFAGCRTGYWNQSYGSPVQGVVAKGAAAALGFNSTIFGDRVEPNGRFVPGAETWCRAFIAALCKGMTISAAGLEADRKTAPGAACRGRTLVGTDLAIYPARYNGQ